MGYLVIPDPPPQQREVMVRHHETQFGGIAFTPRGLVTTGVISFALAKFLGASLPGAMVMGLGSMIFESGSGNIPKGWKRYILGLF